MPSWLPVAVGMIAGTFSTFAFVPQVLKIWREGRMPFEWAALLRSDVIRGVGVPDGDGRGVLLIPGFLAGDGSLSTMTNWLRAAGWWTKSAGIRANVNCSGIACRVVGLIPACAGCLTRFVACTNCDCRAIPADGDGTTELVEGLCIGTLQEVLLRPR